MPTADSFLDTQSAEDFLGDRIRGASGSWETDEKPVAVAPIALGAGATYERPATEEERLFTAAQPSEFSRPLIPPEVMRGAIEIGTGAVPVPDSVRPFVEGFKTGAAQQLAGLTSQESLAMAPAFAIPYVGPGLAYGLGAKAIGTGAGNLVAAIEAGNAQEAGLGASEIVGGGIMAAAPLLHGAKPPVIPEGATAAADIAARNLSQPGTVRPTEIQRIGPTEIEPPAEFYKAPRAPFTSAQRFANYEVPVPEVLPQMGRLKAVEFLEETRPKEELETRGKVSFGAEAPTLLRTSIVPRELVEPAETVGLSRSVEALNESKSNASTERSTTPLPESEIRAPVGEGTPLRQQGEAASAQAPAPEVPAQKLITETEALPISEAGKLRQKSAVEAGLKLTEADVPALEKARDDAAIRMNEALEKDDNDAFKAEYGRNIFYSGAIEGAMRKGPNYDQFLKETAPTIEQRLESLKFKQQTGPELYTNPLKDIPVAVWNGAVDAAILAVKAGRTVAEGIDLAIKEIRKQVNQFDEKAARDYFKTVLVEETKAPPVSGPAASSNTAGAQVRAAGNPQAAGQAQTVGATPQPQAATAGAGTPRATLDDVYKRFVPAPASKPSLGQRAIQAVESFRTGFSSGFRPTNKLAEDLAKMYGGTPKDVAGIFEQLKGSSGKAEADVYRFDRDVSELVKGNEKDFSPYMFLRRSIDRLEQDARDAAAGLPVRRKVSAYSIPDLQSKLALLESNLGPATTAKFQRAADLYQQHMDNALRLQVTSGRMAPQVYNDIKTGNQFYAPFKVMKYLDESIRPEGTGKKIDTVADYTKAMEGIEDQDFKLGDMLAAARQNITLSRVLAEKNMAMQEISRLHGLDTGEILIKQLGPAQEAPKGFEAVNVFEAGERQRYAVNKDVADAVQASPGTAPAILRWAGSLFRAGATTFNLPFQVGNLLIDQARSSLVSKYGLNSTKNLIGYPVDFYQSVLAAISHVRDKPNTLAQDFLDSGAAGATVQEYLSPESLKASPQGGPLRALGTIADLAQAVEETSKILGIKRAMREHGAASGAELARDYPEAITEVRRFAGSPDFGRIGKWTDAYRLNLLQMFLNARIQGAVADIGRLGGRDGAKTAASTWLKVGATVGTPTLLLYLLNHSDKYSKDYEQRPEQEKKNYWLIPKHKFIKGPNGEQLRDYWRIPKREIAQWFANGLEATLDFARLGDPETFWKYAGDTAGQIVPVNIQGKNTQERLESVASGFNPVIKAPLEVATGRDLYRHKNIVPDLMKKATPEQQYTDRTPEAFKKLADMMPDVAPEVFRSPLMLENMVKNFTASAVTQFIPRKPVEGRNAFENTPLMQRFQALPFTDSTDFEERIGRFEREAADEQLERFRTAQKIVEEHKGNLEEAVKAAVKAGGTNVNPKLVERVVDVFIANSQNITANERRIMNLPVEQRAGYISDELKGKSPEERTKLVQDYFRKRIITARVAAELSKKVSL